MCEQTEVSGWGEEGGSGEEENEAGSPQLVPA